MIDHTRYRWLMIVDPRGSYDDPEVREHRESCEECRAFTEPLLRFETRLENALKVPVPEVSNVTPLKRAAPRSAPARWLALAASVVLGLVVASALWVAAPGRSLAAAVVDHMAEEPNAWMRTDAPVAEPALEEILRASHMHLAANPGLVSYASSCAFRGQHVPHLVVQTPSGPVTVMVLAHEAVEKRVNFDEQGYRGTLVPNPGHGSLAVLMKGAGDKRSLDQVAAQVRAAVIFEP